MKKSDSNLCQLYLVRHGETEWNLQHRFQGQQDSALTDQAIAQAKQRARDLKEINFAAVFSSDLLRAKKTAEILKLDRKIAIKTSNLIRERRLGVLEGKDRDRLNRELKDLLNQLGNKKSKKIQNEYNIETIEKFSQRIITFLREVSVAYAGQKVLVVTHSGVIHHILLKIGYQNIKNYSDVSVANLAYLILASDGVDFFVKETDGISLRKS